MPAPLSPSSRRRRARRQPILAGLCLAALISAPTGITAQPAAPYRVATLGADPTQVWDIFQRRLRELGYVEGRNLIIERRWSSGYEDRLPTLMANLLRGNPEVIVTSSMVSADTPIEPAHCVPILLIAVAEPYGPCRTYPVARLSEAASAHEVGATHFRLARALVPSAARFAVLTNADRPYLIEYVKGLEKAVAALKANEADALAKFPKKDGGFRDRDLYVFCFNTTDGKLTSHVDPALLGTDVRALKDAKDGAPFGQEFFDSVKEGGFATVAYNYPKPGGTEAVPKVACLTKVGNQGCGVGYYK